MKYISQQYWYDDQFFSEKIPAEARYLPDASCELPVYIEENFLSEAVCDQVVRTFREAGSHSASPVAIGIRKTEHYDLVGENNKIFQDAFATTKVGIEKFFGAKLLGSTGAHGLGYYPGGLYHIHSDNCDPVFGKPGEILEFKYTDPARQLSVVLFLTDSVKELTGENQAIGGNLVFPFLRDSNKEMLLIEPRKGLFLSFPSNPVFAHEVQEVKDGYRMAIVDWHTASFL